MARNVWFVIFVWRFKTKDRFEHFSSVLISELKDILAIRVEKMWVTYPFCMAAVGSQVRAMPACIEEGEERKQILTFLLWWPKLSLHTKTFIFTFLDLSLFSPTYFSIDKTSIFTIHTPEPTSELGSLYYTSRQTKAQCSLEDFHFCFINHLLSNLVSL